MIYPMHDYNYIFNTVLNYIKPTEEELKLIQDITIKLKELLKQKATELNIEYTTIEPQGSTGIKQTQLRNDFDIDLFIGLDYTLYKTKYKNLSKRKLKEKAKNDFLWYCEKWIMNSLTSSEFQNPRLAYAEHPYVQTDYISGSHDIKIDIVLYFDLEKNFIKNKGPITSVDRTPWHGKFVRDKLTATQKDHVRLLKQFFKASHSYGDKSAVGQNGFIGYSAELLIYHFQNILKVFENFSTLPNTPLDYFKRTKKELSSIPHFQNDYFIITDPTDMNRNVASAISEKAYKYCNYQIHQFLKNPTKSFFEIKEIPKFSQKEFPKLTDHLFIVEFQNTDETIHYTEIRDKLYSLANYLQVHGEKELDHHPKFGSIEFEVYFNPDVNQYNLALYCKHPSIGQFYERKGPPLNQKKHVERFKKKHDNYFVKNGCIFIKAEREYNTFISFLKDRVPSRIPETLVITNISKSLNAQSKSAKQTIFVLAQMVLPFI